MTNTSAKRTPPPCSRFTITSLAGNRIRVMRLLLTSLSMSMTKEVNAKRTPRVLSTPVRLAYLVSDTLASVRTSGGVPQKSCSQAGNVLSYGLEWPGTVIECFEVCIPLLGLGFPPPARRGWASLTSCIPQIPCRPRRNRWSEHHRPRRF